MKNISNIFLLIAIAFLLSCEMGGFDDPFNDSSDIVDPDGDVLPVNPGTETSYTECLSQNTLSVIELEGYGTDLNWTVTEGSFITVIKDGNRISLFAGDDFTGGEIVATAPNAKVTIVLSTCPPPPECYPNYSAQVMDEYIDGTAAGRDAVILNLSSTWPDKTTYQWEIVREDGSVQTYCRQEGPLLPDCAREKTVRVDASLENKITKAIIYVKYRDCQRAIITTFEPPIPQPGGTKSYVNSKSSFFKKIKIKG